MALVRRYWGYGLLLLLVFYLVNSGFDSYVVLPVAGLASIYFLFCVPVWCGAETRAGQLCRNNSRGLLFGCHFRQHKWQVFKSAVALRGARQMRDAYWSSTSQRLATFGAAISSFAVLVSLAGVVLDRS